MIILPRFHETYSKLIQFTHPFSQGFEFMPVFQKVDSGSGFCLVHEKSKTTPGYFFKSAFCFSYLLIGDSQALK